MFSAGVAVSYPCDNSNNSFLESENYIAITGVGQDPCIFSSSYYC